MSAPSAPAGEHRIAYLDGIRAVAILSVLAFHWGGQLGAPLQGGYIGVDLFFVLSGYLITRILWRKGADQSYLAFLKGRVVRLYPALIGVVVVGGILVVAIGGASPLATLVAGGLALGQANSIVVPIDVAITAPFGITWSLSAEWICYLLLPLVLIAGRRLGARRVAIVLAVIAVALYAVSLLMPWMWFYFGPTARAAQLFAGGAVTLATLGWTPGPRLRRLLEPATVLALAAIIAWGVLAYGPDSLRYRYIGLPLVTLAGSVLVVSGAFGAGQVIPRLLSLRPLTALGRASYSLYLWHTIGFAVFASRQPQFPPVTWGLLCFVLVVVATWFSYQYLERPFLRARSSAIEQAATGSATPDEVDSPSGTRSAL